LSYFLLDSLVVIVIVKGRASQQALEIPQLQKFHDFVIG